MNGVLAVLPSHLQSKKALLIYCREGRTPVVVVIYPQMRSGTKFYLN